jgi:hypothetical protein
MRYNISTKQEDLPIRDLWCAVIQQAYEDTRIMNKKFQCESRNKQYNMDYDSAIQFFKSDFFERLCECLSLDHKSIKAKALT